uniref:Uncharacterized protein n=1 Tax=Phytophthora ramorum TaxID=164328 RepID=H3GET7_PHYRM
MKKYEDTWVVDRTMFEYVNQGGCSCCGVTHTIMNLAEFASKCSDWGMNFCTLQFMVVVVLIGGDTLAETDDEKKEQFSPWPTFIHEEILTERARLRMAMKADMKKYKEFVDEHLKGFMAWWSRLGENAKARIFQLPDDEVLSYFRVHTKVKGSYEIHQRESFVLDPQYVVMEAGDTNFFEMLKILGGPKLLPVRTTRNANEKSEAESEQTKSENNVQSFRSDRRLARLVMFRIFADMAIRKYKREVVNADLNNTGAQ